MAEIPTLTISLSDEFSQALKETREELEAAKEALSEEHIRQIVREELAAWKKRLLEAKGIVMDAAPLQEMTFIHEYDPSRELVHIPKGSSIVPDSELTKHLKDAKVTLMLDGIPLARVSEE